MTRFEVLFQRLWGHYGPQGWWPLGAGAAGGYHPGEYSLPNTAAQRTEIIIGTILTQNTAWKNARRALENLRASQALDWQVIIQMPQAKLAQIIKPSGYHNQKAKKLQIAGVFFHNNTAEIPVRQDLLGLWGIGPETADSILLYAYHVVVFVVDAYTIRCLSRLGLLGVEATYSSAQLLLERKITREYRTYNEFHALLVRHAKELCRKNPRCERCFLRLDLCRQTLR